MHQERSNEDGRISDSATRIGTRTSIVAIDRHIALFMSVKCNGSVGLESNA
jgi:hypothetical protein